MQCAMDVPGADEAGLAHAIGTRSESEVRSFIAAVRKAAPGVLVTSSSDNPSAAVTILSLRASSGGSMWVYSTDCHGCGGRLENQKGGGGGGVQFRCQDPRCGREFCATCMKSKQSKELKTLVSKADARAGTDAKGKSSIWPFSRAVWPILANEGLAFISPRAFTY